MGQVLNLHLPCGQQGPTTETITCCSQQHMNRKLESQAWLGLKLSCFTKGRGCPMQHLCQAPALDASFLWLEHDIHSLYLFQESDITHHSPLLWIVLLLCAILPIKCNLGSFGPFPSSFSSSVSRPAFDNHYSTLHFCENTF